MDNKDTTGIRCLLSVSVKYRELLVWVRWEVIWLQTMRILRKRVLFTLSYFLRYSYQIFTCISTQSKYFLSSYSDQMFMRISIHVETPSDSQTSQIFLVLWMNIRALHDWNSYADFVIVPCSSKSPGSSQMAITGPATSSLFHPQPHSSN